MTSFGVIRRIGYKALALLLTFCVAVVSTISIQPATAVAQNEVQNVPDPKCSSDVSKNTVEVQLEPTSKTAFINVDEGVLQDKGIKTGMFKEGLSQIKQTYSLEWYPGTFTLNRTSLDGTKYIFISPIALWGLQGDYANKSYTFTDLMNANDTKNSSFFTKVASATVVAMASGIIRMIFGKWASDKYISWFTGTTKTPAEVDKKEAVVLAYPAVYVQKDGQVAAPLSVVYASYDYYPNRDYNSTYIENYALTEQQPTITGFDMYINSYNTPPCNLQIDSAKFQAIKNDPSWPNVSPIDAPRTGTINRNSDRSDDSRCGSPSMGIIFRWIGCFLTNGLLDIVKAVLTLGSVQSTTTPAPTTSTSTTPTPLEQSIQSQTPTYTPAAETLPGQPSNSSGFGL